MKLRTIAISLVAVVAVASAIAAEKASKGEKGEEAKAVLKGSITVGKEADTKVLDMAKISLADAVAAAVAKVPGKCWKAELESEDGSLIYTVQVVTKEGEWKEIAVDAGDGKILLVEKGDREEFEGTSEKGKKEGCKKGEKKGKGEDSDDDKD